MAVIPRGTVYFFVCVFCLFGALDHDCVKQGLARLFCQCFKNLPTRQGSGPLPTMLIFVLVPSVVVLAPFGDTCVCQELVLCRCRQELTLRYLVIHALLLCQELIRKTKDSVVKEKEDEDARLKSQAKRLDYITRALRIEEMPVLRKKYEAQV